MRPRHPHAAESGVGKHTARESERAQACATGKERVANAHPQKLASEPSKSSGAFFIALMRRMPAHTTSLSVLTNPTGRKARATWYGLSSPCSIYPFDFSPVRFSRWLPPFYDSF